MNWIKIEEKYPKSWKLINNTDDRMAAVRLGIKGFNNRFLFDVFDEQEIHIEINKYYHKDGGLRWCYEISNILDYNLDNSLSTVYKIRTEAEEKAFKKAFPILENKLEGKK